jgi:hypothetical protein
LEQPLGRLARSFQPADRSRSDFTRDPGRRDQIIPQEDFTISNIEIVLHGSKVAPDVPIFGGHARNINALSVWSA